MNKSHSLIIALFFSVGLSATDERSANELTEVWQPVPAIVATCRPEPDAIVLFDGKTRRLGTRQTGWKRAGENRRRHDGCNSPNQKPCDMRTKKSLVTIQLHLEWRTPPRSKGKVRTAATAVCFFYGTRMNCRFSTRGENPLHVNGQAASVYKEHAPLVNASRRPGEWQVYDVVFIAPRFSADGKTLQRPRLDSPHSTTAYWCNTT